MCLSSHSSLATRAGSTSRPLRTQQRRAYRLSFALTPPSKDRKRVSWSAGSTSPGLSWTEASPWESKDTPGPFTFILEATKEVPRRLSHPSRRTIGLRVPEHRVTQELLALFGQPLLATTLIAPGETEPMNDAHEIRERFEKSLAAIIDAGACPMQPTTVIDLSGDEPVLLRPGRGDPARLGLALD